MLVMLVDGSLAAVMRGRDMDAQAAADSSTRFHPGGRPGAEHAGDDKPYWFAPALAGWWKLPAPKAMFFSFYACLRNWRPFVALRARAGDLRRPAARPRGRVLLEPVSPTLGSVAALPVPLIILPIVFAVSTPPPATCSASPRTPARDPAAHDDARWRLSPRLRRPEPLFEPPARAPPRRARRHLRPHPHRPPAPRRIAREALGLDGGASSPPASRRNRGEPGSTAGRTARPWHGCHRRQPRFSAMTARCAQQKSYTVPTFRAPGAPRSARSSCWC